MILEYVQNDDNTIREFQESRDFITQSLVRDLEHRAVELAQIDTEIEKMLKSFDYKLTTMPSVGDAIASKLIAEIGDIRHFPNADKLACFAGIVPKSFSSAGKDRDESNKQGNRELHGLFYFLAVTMVSVSTKGKPYNPIFRAYFLRKISEGKTKSQALVCVMRRLVSIIYGMMKNKYETFVKMGKRPTTNETFISPTKSFSEKYSGVTVEFKVKAGTTNELVKNRCKRFFGNSKRCIWEYAYCK